MWIVELQLCIVLALNVLKFLLGIHFWVSIVFVIVILVIVIRFSDPRRIGCKKGFVVFKRGEMTNSVGRFIGDNASPILYTLISIKLFFVFSQYLKNGPRSNSSTR